MKVITVILLLTIVALCLLPELEAKKHKGDKVKAEKVKEKVIHKPVKPQPDQQAPLEPASKKTKHAKTEKSAKPADHTIDEQKKPLKLRSTKTLSEYEKCKLECKRKRDSLSTQEYVNQLTEELKAAKELLAQQENEATGNIPQAETKAPPSDEQHLEGIPSIPKPIIEVTLHQTSKDEV